MTVEINDPELEHDVERLAAELGKPMDEAVRFAIRRTLLQLPPSATKHHAGRPPGFRSPAEVMAFIASFNLKDGSPGIADDEILGYNENGLFD